MKTKWLALGVALLAGCPGGGGGETVTLGAVLSLTGSLANIGAEDVQAIQLAIEQINAAGGANGSQLALVTKDDATMSDRSPMQATALINESKVPVIFGAIGSGATLKTMAVTAAAKVVQVTGSSTSPAITTAADDGYLFRTCASDALQGKLVAQRAKAKMFTKVAVIHEPEAYGQGLADAFAASFMAGGGTVTYKMPYLPAQASYMAQLTAAYATNPEAILLVAYPDEGIQIIKDYNNAFAAKGTYWFFTDALEDKAFIDGVGASGFQFMHEATGPATPTGANYDAFKSAFKTKYGKDPNPGTFSPHFYDAAYLVALAISAAQKTDGTSIRDSMNAVSKGGTKYGAAQYTTAAADAKAGKDIDYEGVSSGVDLDATGEVVAPYDIWKVAAGNISITETNISP